MKLAVEIEACERAVWQALADGDAAADRAALAADFPGVYPDGFAGRPWRISFCRSCGCVRLARITR